MPGSGYPSNYATQLDQTWTDESLYESAGTIRVQGNKHYVAVKAHAAITAGKFCEYRTDRTVVMSGGTGVGAGWCEHGIAKDSIGWVQYQGFAEVPAANLDSGVGDGDACTLSDTAGNLRAINNHDLPLMADCIDESAGLVFMRCVGGW